MTAPPRAAAPADPLQIEAVQAGAVREWRTGEGLEEYHSEDWQLVYVLSGMVEESCDGKPHRLRTGRILFHQPEEGCAMRAVSEVPPEVLRVAFTAHGPGMDVFRGRSLTLNAAERNCLRLLAGTVHEVFAPSPETGRISMLRPDPPYGAARLNALYLEELLLLLARRMQRGGKRPAPRTVAEQKNVAIFEGVRVFLAENIERGFSIAELCRLTGYSRGALEQAFRARAKMGVVEYFTRMKVEHAALLLAQGYNPGQTAKMLGYSSPSYFSQRFRALAGCTPSQYARAPYPLHLCNK